MNIVRHEILSEVETLDRLRNVPLRGMEGDTKQVFIYRHAHLEILENTPVDSLVPPQRYVLKGRVDDIINLARIFEEREVDVFSLRGALLFWTDEIDPGGDPIPFLPPVVEQSTEKDGRVVKLVNDGMHRVYAARSIGRRINIIFASNLPSEYPYYSYGMMEGWGAVKVFDELPDEFQKKDYRNPSNYKALFRQFNKVFPGIQEKRKQTNPSHIRE